MCAVYLWKQQDVSNHGRMQECLSQVEAEDTRCHRAHFLLILVVKNWAFLLSVGFLSHCAPVSHPFFWNYVVNKELLSKAVSSWLNTSLLYQLSSLSRDGHMLAKHAMVSSTQGC
jgi:hypothetical protein